MGLPVAPRRRASPCADGVAEPTVRPDWTRPALAAILAVALIALVYSLVFPNLWYGEHDISDIGLYQWYARSMAVGEQPYRDFDFEYPPMAAWLLALPGHSDSSAGYTTWFSLLTFILAAGAGAAVAATAAAIWPSGPWPFLAAVLFAAAIGALGAIVENKFDIAVALVVALVVLCLARRWILAAAVLVGLGFALKLTPAVLLPLVLLLAPTPRRAAWAAGAFAAAALAPFVPYLAVSPSGVWHVFAYHLERPLQIESVLGTPFLVGRLWDIGWVDVISSFGSQGIAARGSGIAATAAGVLTMLSLGLVTILIVRRRRTLIESPETMPLAALCLLLGLVTFGKVLSPQFMVWLLPVAALTALSQPLVGLLAYASLLLTQINFPAKYVALVYLEPSAIRWLAVRNIFLVATFVAALWQLSTLPSDTEPKGRLSGRIARPAAGRARSARLEGRDTPPKH